MAPTDSAVKGKRSRTGCGTCRARKVKCDERPNGCANCARLQIPCLRPVTPISSTSSEAREHAVNAERFHRHRTFRSCNACRTAKVRCSGERPCCERCRRRAAKCEYDGKEAPRWINRASNWRGSDGQEQRNTTPSSFDYSSGDNSDEEMSNVFENGATGAENRQPGQHMAGISPGSAESRDMGDTVDSLSWLFSTALPSYNRTLRLVKTYFRLIHPLRCFGFIHRPSWMQCFEDQSQKDRNNNAVLLMMCALGAKFYAVATPKSQRRGASYALRAGTQWAQRAKQLLFMSLNSPNPETIMAAILLHEHELRVGNYSSAFMITGLAVRLVQGLQLNVEPMSVQPRPESKMAPATFLESCRRIMWSVYVMDSWVGSGVDELTMIHEKNIRIRLPSDETDFTLETTKATTAPMFPLDEQSISISQSGELDVAAHFVLLLGLRKQVLRLVKHLDESQPPWSQDSEFSLVCQSLSQWAECLPKSLQFDRSAIQKRKISNQHGALMLLHLTYHQTMCDLTRIGMPELFRIRAPFQFPPDKADFVERVQNACFDNCIAVTNVFREALHHGLEGFADTWLCVVAHDSLRVVVHYLSKRLGTPARHEDNVLRDMTVEGVGANLRVLEKLIPLQALAKPLHASALATIKAAGIEVPSTVPGTVDGSELFNEEPGPRAPSPAPHTPEYVLNPLAIYRMARQDIRQHEKKPSAPNEDPPPETDLPSPQHLPPAPPIPSDMDTLHETNDVAQSEMGYYNGQILDAFDLPLSFDGLQAYMSLPPLLNQYSDMGLGRADADTGFGFGDSAQTSGFGASNYNTGVGETTDMQYGGPHQVWMG